MTIFNNKEAPKSIKILLKWLRDSSENPTATAGKRGVVADSPTAAAKHHKFQNTDYKTIKQELSDWWHAPNYKNDSNI